MDDILYHTQETILGKHLIADFYDIEDVSLLSDEEKLKQIILNSATKSGATILRYDSHHFGEGCGVTGVAILAESHISFHSWPERKYIGIDIFLCGKCNPYDALKILNDEIKPGYSRIDELKRGIFND